MHPNAIAAQLYAEMAFAYADAARKVDRAAARLEKTGDLNDALTKRNAAYRSHGDALDYANRAYGLVQSRTNRRRRDRYAAADTAALNLIVALESEIGL